MLRFPETTVLLESGSKYDNANARFARRIRIVLLRRDVSNPPTHVKGNGKKTPLPHSIATVLGIGLLLALGPSLASATTFTVRVGEGGNRFSPVSVTIEAGDTVQWTWSAGGHTTTSGSPGSPDGIWDSGIRNNGATFSHTFDTAGSFPYFCGPHGSCCGMTGTVNVSSPTPTPTPTATPAPTPTPTPDPRPATLGNISTRLQVGTADRVMIAGFIVQGSAPKRVLIRAGGPSLAQFGVPNTLANPRLDLHDTSNTIGMNDNWQTTQIGGVITSDQVAEIQNSGLAPSDPAESAIIVTLPPGAYTAIVQGVNGGTGVGIVEVFDVNPTSGSLLVNISTRGFVQTGDNVMIGGFIVVTQPTRVIIRAIGPSLTQLGVPDALANPQLELHQATTGLIARNDDWQTTQFGGIIASDQVAEIQNSQLGPTNPAESAIIATLQPGGYTAIVAAQ